MTELKQYKYPDFSSAENMSVAALLNTKIALENGLDDKTDYKEFGLTKEEYDLIKKNNRKQLREVEKYIHIRAKEIMFQRSLTAEQKNEIEVKKLKKELSRYLAHYNKYKVILALHHGDMPEAEEWFMSDTVKDDEINIAKLEKKIRFLSNPEQYINGRKTFDIQAIKMIPIDSIVEVNRAGFFRIRDKDKTPSCKWYKEANTWTDFGNGSGKHDIIDLVMILKSLDFIGACKFLSR